MPRARNIKPSLFKNEVLGTANPLLTILFEGLWCLADRDGRLEDRPMRINAEIFPYRGMSGDEIDGHLTWLAVQGFIRRYQVGGHKVIQVVKFAKHQAPHNTEKASELPAEPIEKKEDKEITVKQPLDNGEVTVKERLDNALIPDSLNTDSLIPECGIADAETAPPAPTTSEPPDSRLPGDSYFDHPAVQVYEEKFSVKVQRAFAKEIVENVHDLTLWNRLITKKIAFAAGSTKDRQRIATWFLSAYFEELEKQNGTNRPKSFQDQRAERAATDHRFTNDLRQRITERNRKLLGGSVSGSDRQLQPVESIANGGGESGAG